MSEKTRAGEAGSRKKRAEDPAAEPADASGEAVDEAVRELRRENEGLRHRLQAAEEVLEDLGASCQEASKITLQNRELRDELESLRAAVHDVEKGLPRSGDTADVTRRPEVDPGTANPRTPVNASGGQERGAEEVTGQGAASVGSEGPLEPETVPSVRPALSGSLDQMPIAAVVQMLATAYRTGLLTLNSGGIDDRKTGAIYFSDGQIVGCDFETTEGALVDQEAFHAMMVLPEGSFRLVTEETAFEPRMRAAAEGLLLEAARRLDEREPEVRPRQATATRDPNPPTPELDQTDRPDEADEAEDAEGARREPAGRGGAPEGTEAAPSPVEPREGAEQDRFDAREVRRGDATSARRITRTRIARTTRPGVTQAVTFDPAKGLSGRAFVTHLDRGRERVRIREHVEVLYRFVSPARPEWSRRSYQGELLEISFEGGQLQGAVPEEISRGHLSARYLVVETRMELPFVEAPLVIDARVKWVKPFDESVCALGLSFVDVTNEHLRIIRGFLIGLQSPARSKSRRSRYR